MTVSLSRDFRAFEHAAGNTFIMITLRLVSRSKICHLK